MSQLSPFVRSFRALSVAFDAESLKAQATGNDETVSASSRVDELDRAILLVHISAAFSAAATDLEQQIAADLSRVGRVVEIPHRVTSPEEGSPQPENDTTGDWADRVG